MFKAGNIVTLTPYVRSLCHRHCDGLFSLCYGVVISCDQVGLVIDDDEQQTSITVLFGHTLCSVNTWVIQFFEQAED